MKNIVICFDGTWNTADAMFPTNVVKTAQLLLPRDAKGADQVVFYDEGVGTSQAAFGSAINNLLGGAFGIGLMDNIEHAYRFLTLNYSPGDRIFLFGFSRGAFSARSFNGLIRTCGILHKDNIKLVKEAINKYQDPKREKGADAEVCVGFRSKHCVASYPAETLAPHQHLLSVEYIGVWDTVGSLGVPAPFIFANYFNKKYQFHDLMLSSMVKSARHAVSIDERRHTFEPTPWNNLGELNGTTGQSTSELPYQQVWFPGDHASVGGGGDVNGLWQAALVWVVEGAQRRGLAINQDMLEKYRHDIDYKAQVNCMKRPMFSLSSISFYGSRRGPDKGAITDVAEVAQKKIKAPASDLEERRRYRPKTLKSYIDTFRKELGVTWR
jgi:uncharacterized protein (DUF2235 family)